MHALTERTTKPTQAVGTFHPRADKKTAYRRLTHNIGGLYGLHSQTVMNSNDHGARQIWVTVAGRGSDYGLTFLDDGRGMNKERRERFMNLGFTNESSEGYGYQGLGTKRMDADFAHCKVETIAEEEPGKLWTWEFDFDNLIALLADEGGDPIAYYCSPTPAQAASLAESIGLPKGRLTGTRITLTKSRERHVSPRFTDETLRKNWADYLDPWVADKILVNGLPLRKRQIHGNPIQWDDPQPKGSSKLGLIRVQLYVPKNRSVRDDLAIGAVGPICSWKTFVQQHIPEELWSDDLQVLSEDVFGCIYCDGLKRFITASRDNFEVRLSTSDVLQEFLQYLIVHVVPEVRKVVGDVKQLAVGAQEEQLLDDLRRYLDHLSGGEDRVVPPPGPRPILQIDPTSIEVCPGETVRIVASRYDPNLTLKWETADAGGNAEVRQNGWDVRYKAGKVHGHFGLTAYYKEVPDTRAHVDITIVPKKVLRIEPHRFQIAFGREMRLHVLNADVASSGAENIRWRVATDDSEGRFVYTAGDREKVSTTGYGLELRYRAGDTPGTFRIEAYDKKNRLAVAYSDATVCEPSDGTVIRKQPRKDFVIIGGCPYKVTFTDNQLGFLLRRLEPRHTSDPVELIINRHAGAYVDVQNSRGRDGVFELCMNQILFQHVAYTSTDDERMRPDLLVDKVAQLYNTMVERLKKSEA